MSKVKPEEATTALTTAPASAMSLIPDASTLDDGFKAPSTNQFLPHLEMVFPIMVTPDAPSYKGHDYKIGFKNGDKFVPLPAGTVLTVVDKRNAVRIKHKQPDGSTKNEYGYAAIDRKGKQFATSAALYNEMAPKAKGDPNIDDGYSMVVIALLPDGSTTVVDFAAFKTMTSYMYAALSPAMFVQQPPIGLRIDIEDHTPNLKKSTSGFFYPDAKKFKQWAHVQLTPDQVKKAVEAISLNSEHYMNWLNR